MKPDRLLLASATALTDEELLALINLDFSLFVQQMHAATTSGETLIWHPYLDLICSRLQDVAHGVRRNLIITMPPRHLKSFCVSVCLPAYVLGHYPGQEVMCISYGYQLANEFAAASLRIMQHPLYRAAFGEVLKSPRQPLAAIRTQAGGVRRATSLEGTATGVGGNLLIFDDPQKPGEALSDAIRRSTNQAFEQTFLSRRNPPGGARMVIVMQRLHEDDFVAHVQALGGSWEVLNLPAIAEEDQEIPFSAFPKDRIYRRKEGEALHPGRVPLSELEEIRKISGEAVFAAQYQQRPAPAGGGLVKIDWFRRYRPSDLPARFDRILQSWDTANTISEWSDYTVCTTWGLLGESAYLLNVFRARLLYPELKKAVAEQARLFKATEIVVEDRASGTQLLQELRPAGFSMMRGVKPTADKETRMVNQTARIENGLVWVPEEAPWLSTYLHEFTVFPNGKYDDQVDSTSQALGQIGIWKNSMGLFEYYRRQAIEIRGYE